MTRPALRPLSDLFDGKGYARATMRARAATQIMIGKLRGLHDPVYGAVGAFLHDRIRASHCRIDYDFTMPILAAHTSFVYPPRPREKSFANIMMLGARAVTDDDAHFSALVHEGAHAAQMAHCAAAHASPFNAATTVILCPRDFVMMCERAEQDAYARQTWLQSLAGTPAAKTENEPVPQTTFHALRVQEGGDTLAALRRAAVMMLDRHGFSSRSGDNVRLADSYHEIALRAYWRVIAARPDRGALQFVRAQDTDIIAMGAASGPSLFGDENGVLPEFAGPVALSPRNARLLRKINAILGIENDGDLPYLSAVLQQRGHTPDSFLASSKKFAAAPSAHAATTHTIKRHPQI